MQLSMKRRRATRLVARPARISESS